MAKDGLAVSKIAPGFPVGREMELPSLSKSGITIRKKGNLSAAK